LYFKQKLVYNYILVASLKDSYAKKAYILVYIIIKVVIIYISYGLLMSYFEFINYVNSNQYIKFYF
jgi:hypothetical protein